MKASVVLFLLCIITGCSSVPDATLTYYQPKAELVLKITQTAFCYNAGDKDNPDWRTVAKTSANLTPNYTANENFKHTFEFDSLNSFGTDAEATISLSEDGRLKTINASSTGKGKSIIDSAITIGKSIASLAGMPLFLDDKKYTVDEIAQACQLLLATTENKPLTIEVTRIISDLDFNKPILTAGLKETYEELDPIFPKTYVVLEMLDNLEPRISFPACKDNCYKDKPVIYLPSHYKVKAVAYVSKSIGEVEAVPSPEAKTIGEAVFLYPDAANVTPLLLYQGGFFGKSEISLSLGDAGQVTSIKYGTSESSSAIEGLASIAEVFKKEDEPAEYEKIKAENDLAYEQQRQIACELNPSVESCK